MDQQNPETAIPRDKSMASLSVDNTIISKIDAYSYDNYSYFSKDGIKTNIEKDKVFPVMFGVDGDSRNSISFDAKGYKNEKFVESGCLISGWERIYAIEKFDEGIVVGENDKTLTKISTEPYSLGDYKAPTEKKTYNDCSVGTAGGVSLVYFSNTYNNEKYDFAFPFRGDTLYVSSFYTSKYVNGVPTRYAKQEIRSGIDDVNFFSSINDDSPSRERNRNIVASSFNEIPENAKFIGHKLFITPENSNESIYTWFYRNSIFASKGYVKYCVLCFESGAETYEIGFKVDTDKYFYPTIAEPDDDQQVHSIVYGKNNNGYSVKYCCEFTKAHKNVTKSSLKNVITAFYMNDKPSKLKGNGVWAAKNDGANSYPIRYLKTSRDCYFKLVIRANTEADPAKVNDGTWKDFTICASGFDDSFKNAMVREYKTWKRWDGNDTFEYGDGIAGYDLSTDRKQTDKSVRPVKLLSAGATVGYDDKLYDVIYRKVSTKNSWGGFGDPCLYVKNGKLHDGDKRECAKGNPFEGSGSNLSSKFEALSVLQGHEGVIGYFYSCQAGVITYGVGFTWVSAKKNNEGELEQWRKFFRAAKANSDIKISLKHPSLTSFNTGAERSGAINELYQNDADGQIYFRKISTKELLTNVYPWNGATALPVVSVPSSHIQTKSEALAVEYAGIVYNETIRKIETVKNPDGSIGGLANVDFNRWVGDKNGTYTIRSRITQEQWDYLVDARYQGNSDMFRYLRGGTSLESGIGKECTSYKEFCDRALEGIKYYNQNQRTDPSKWYFLRSSEWRNGPLKRVFSNIPPEDAVPNANNDQDDVKYYAHQITISCHSMGRGKIDTVMLESDSDNRGANPRSYISYYSKKAVGPTISENEDDIVYYMTSYMEEDAKNDAAQAVKVSQDDMDWGRFKDIVNRWSCKITKEGDAAVQKLIGVDRYYDFYTGMTPFIQAYFREGFNKDGSSKWNILNSLQHPYFKSLTVEDKGVKTATLTLFDKDFGSYQYGIVVDPTTDNVDTRTKINSDEKVNKNPFEKKVYSLETIIKKALVQYEDADKKTVSDDSSDGANDGNNYKDFTEEELKETYLKYDTYKLKDPTNLRIRFGYADDNPPVTEKQFKGDKSENGYKNYNNQKFGGGDTGETNRDYRWYDVRNPGKERSMEVKPKAYFDGSSIVEDGKVTIAAYETQQIDNFLGKELNEEEKVNKHVDITTVKSYVRNYMIIGYETSLKPNGIQYTIKAVETGYASLMRKRFLQRYHELTSNPIEVLAALMTIFNEPQQGKPNTKSGFKLYYAVAPDEDADNAADTLNMLFDFGSLSDEDREKYSWAKDSYTVNIMNKNGLGEFGEFGREIYKKITVKLGGESALGNMARNTNYGKPALYKSVASLIDEFCSACPSKKFGLPDSDKKAYDKDGNEITNDSYESQARLGWFLGKYEGGGKDGELCVVLYYKRPRKLGRIRVYRWGPELPYKTVVKSLNVKNNNEFAILSAVDTFEEGTNGAVVRCKINARNMNLSKANDSETKLISHDLAVTRSFSDLARGLDNNGAEIVSYVAPNRKEANKYDLAFSSCMYTGTMEMLGDPSLEFNMLLQPYTYPIRLEVYVPRNELAFKARDWGVADADEENKDAQKSQNETSIVNKIREAEEEYGARESIGFHQVHEMSGYYVITSITHNISTSGYTTTLGIASYPNIEKDVLYVDSDGVPIQPDHLY